MLNEFGLNATFTPKESAAYSDYAISGDASMVIDGFGSTTSTQHPFEAYDSFMYENYILPDEIKLNNLNKNNDIFVKYYAKRCENAPWLLVKIDFINI